MNMTKTNLINKICAILVIFAMTISDFALVGKTAVSYAIDEVKTNHANVEFNAYFQNENGDKVGEKEASIDGEEYLYVEVSVKNEGYLNNGEIKISDNNFNIKEDKLSQEVAEIKDNTVKLNQLNAGSTATIKLAIEAKKENNIKESGLNGKTKVELGGEYINSKNVEKNKYVEIKGTAEVGMKWKSSEETKVELDGKLLTNSVYDVNGENKRLVQMLISSKVNNNSYPVKTNEITLNVPEKVEEVKVTARDTKGTNSKAEFGEGNYEYNKDEKRLTIKVSNEDTENISWEKEAEDMFVVTYVLNPNENIANEDIQVKDKMKLYDDREIEENKNVHIEEEIDGVVSSTIESSENEIYKGKIYTGEERDYTEINKVNVDYVEADEKLEIDQKAATYIEGENEKEANIVYKETKIKKDEFQKIFGDDGYIEIQNGDGTVLQNINKDTEANEEGKIVITYPDGEKEIKLETSKAENIGTLEIENTKGIMSAGYGREEIRNLTGIKEKVTVNGKVAEKVIGLKETETKANISLDVTKISTVAEKQEITVNATLEANDESKDLYKNPRVTIKLPKEIRVKNAQYAALYKNGLEIESTNLSTNGNGEAEIKLQFKGEQTKYDISGGTKICLKLEVEADKLTPSKASQIEMKYWNENKNEEKTETAGINFESQYGIMIYNQIQNYNNNGDAIVTIDKETAYGELGTNGEAKNLVLNTALLNNYGEKVTNVTLIGKIPSDGSEEGYVAKLKEIQTNNDKVKITYSNKQDAEAGDDSWGEYKEDAVSYKVVVDEMDKEEVIKLNVPVTIPENLKYNEKGSLSSKVTANYQGNIEENTSNIVLSTKTSMSASTTEKVAVQETNTGLNTQISALMGNDSLSNGDNIYEGQTIKYKVTITNNTGKDYTNVAVKANQKNGYVWDLVQHDVYNPLYDKNFQEHYYEITSSNEKTLGVINSLKNGESYTYEYEASIYMLNDEKIDGNETYGNITVSTSDASLNETITTIKNKIKSAKVQINAFDGSTNEIEVSKESVIKKRLIVKNLTNTALSDLQLKIAFAPKLEVDIPLTDEIKAKITDKDMTTDKDGVTTVTLKLSALEAGETIDIDLFPSTTAEFDIEKDEAWVLAEAVTSDKDSYVSNKSERKIYDITKNIELKQEALNENGNEINTQNDKLNDSEKITLVATIKNNEAKDVYVDVEYNIDENLSIENAKITNPDGSEEDVTAQSSSNDINKEKQTINPGEMVTLTISGTVSALDVDELISELSATDDEYRNTLTDTMSLSVNKQEDSIPDDEVEDDNIHPEDELPDDVDDNTTDDDNNSNDNSDDNNSNNSTNSDNTNIQQNDNTGDENSSSEQEVPENSSIVSGTAWKDENKDGVKDDNEEKISDMTVDAMNADNGQIVASTKTDANGKYEFTLENGKYIILFHYDNSIYTTTTYQSNGVEEDKNSDAIERDVDINGSSSKLGATDALAIDKNTENIDIGLVTRNTFDLKIDKYVSKITVKNDAKTAEYDQKDNTKLAKAEIKSKNLDGSLVVIEYKIKVTNKGDVAGYARKIVDYMPSTLSFNSSLNSDWYISGNNIYTTSLANTKIEPGETKEVTVVLTKTMTESNTGLINNKAAIDESSNELGIKDASNDKGSADVIISVSTGALVNYVTTTVITLIVLLGLAYFVNKKYLNKKI